MPPNCSSPLNFKGGVGEGYTHSVLVVRPEVERTTKTPNLICTQNHQEDKQNVAGERSETATSTKSEAMSGMKDSKTNPIKECVKNLHCIRLSLPESLP